MKLKMFSIAAHSTWNFCPDHHFAIDAGEGMATAIGIGSASALNTILITHAHMDHVAGLVNLVHLRKRMGNDSPLRIYEPELGDRMKRIMGIAPGADYILATPFEEIPLSAKLCAVPIPTQHGRAVSVGYQIFETRKRRKACYANLTTEDMQRLASQPGFDASNLNEEFRHHVFTYTGDTRLLEPHLYGNPQTLIHEATYPVDGLGDEKHAHSRLRDALQVYRECGASRLIINHLSLRWLEKPEYLTSVPPGVDIVQPKNWWQEFNVAG
jgi:ribonuclease BN (tRNA processing enzyme)